MTSTAIRLRHSTLTVLLVLGTAGLLGGCAASADQASAPSATQTGPAAVTEAAPPSASAEAASPVPEGFGVPAPAGKRVDSPNGNYMQSTIADDDPAMQFSLAIVHESALAHDFAELESAQRAIVRFMAEEVIDSRLNGGDRDVDAWWESNKHRIDPAAQSNLHQGLVSGKNLVLQEIWQKEEYGDRYYYLTSPDQTRIYDRVITPTMIWSPEPGSIALEAQVSYLIPVVPNVGITGTGIQTTTGTLTIGVVKDAAGNWVINGYQHDVNTIQG